MNPKAIRRAVRWKTSLRHYDVAVDGYMLYGPLLARRVINNPMTMGTRMLKFVARAILYHENHLAIGRHYRWKLWPAFSHAAFDLTSRPIGYISRFLGLNTGVRCPVVHDMLIQRNLNFPLVWTR